MPSRVVSRKGHAFSDKSKAAIMATLLTSFLAQECTTNICFSSLLSQQLLRYCFRSSVTLQLVTRYVALPQNTVTVNSRDVQEAHLADGDTIGLGASTSFLVHFY